VSDPLFVEKAEIVRATRMERMRTLALLRPLEPAQWEVEALPGWRIREVAAHLITIDRGSVTGGIFPQVLRSSDHLERWNDRQVGKFADRPIQELLLSLDRWGRRLSRVVRRVPAAALRLRLPTMWGRGPGRMFPWSRPFDEWVHRQDVRRALGMPDETADLATVAGFVLAAATTSVLPALRGRPGTITVDLAGVPLPPYTAEYRTGRAALGERPPDADPATSATVTADAPAFVMTATGRGSFEELESSGGLAIEGHRETAEAFLRDLRVV
jgi:uncharacterized protein (TIGR03083 family)